MTISGILFDKDGVLVDFQRTYAPSTLSVIEALADGDGEVVIRLAKAVDFDAEAVSFGTGSVVIAGTAADIARAWHPHLPQLSQDELIDQVETLYDDITLRHVTPFDEVDAALTALTGRGLKLGLATNDTEESAHRHLAAIGQKDRFDFISGYDSGHGSKPAPGMILAFARQVGVDPAQIVMVGDSLHDMHAGRSAGAICVAVTTGMAGRAILAPHADHVIDSLSKLSELVSTISA